MAKRKQTRTTTVGRIQDNVLAFTVGKDTELDLVLAELDCIGSAAHVTMLSRMKGRARQFSVAERKKIISELLRIVRSIRKGDFEITVDDQDVHMAVERLLTERLGDLGKRIHTGRSRNDQVAVDLRLYGKQELLGTIEDAVSLCASLLELAQTHKMVPMVGRTHLQPGMPSSCGLFFSSYVESLLDDIVCLMGAFELNDQCPLGSAAGYGVPLPLDRHLTSELLGFARPQHNVLYASNSRGKCESVILSALSQVMVTLSRLSQDLILYSMPEFGYFKLPEAYCTGSSIMPQKKNPDILELIRAKASRVIGHHASSVSILNGLPGGYNRDLQDAKEPFVEGFQITQSCLQILGDMLQVLDVDEQALRDGFSPDVFATDAALARVAVGVPFRDAYDEVKANLSELDDMDPDDAVAAKTHYGTTGGLELDETASRVAAAAAFVIEERQSMNRAFSKLLGVRYPELKKGKS